MTNQENKNQQWIKDKLQSFTTAMHSRYEQGWNQGFKEGLQVAVSLMMDTPYRDLDREFIERIDRILENE